jgi:hypothetical protein
MPQHAEDYSTTVIYKIRCLDENITDCYVGHTTRFDARMFQHSNNIGKYDYKLYQVIEQNGGWSNWIMEEIEKYPCDDVYKALERERYYYDILCPSLNMIRPCRTDEEKHEQMLKDSRSARLRHLEDRRERCKLYHLSHLEEHKERCKKAYWDNREERLTYGLEQIQCPCGGTYKKRDKSHHIKTIKHKNYELTLK